MNVNVEEIFTMLKMLELEKNKIKIELGNCEDASIDSEFDTASVWESVSLMSHFLTSKLQLSDISSTWPDPDKLSCRIFKADTRKKLAEHQNLFNQVAFKWEMNAQIDFLQKGNKDLRNQVRDLNARFNTINLCFQEIT